MRHELPILLNIVRNKSEKAIGYKFFDAKNGGQDVIKQRYIVIIITNKTPNLRTKGVLKNRS